MLCTSHASMDLRHLSYFKDLVEGRAEISFQAYFRQHRESIKQQLPRAQYLRLKFAPTDEILQILNAANIDFVINDHAIRREKYLSSFHPDVLDEKGRITEAHRNTVFGGAIKLFSDGKEFEAKAAVETHLRIHKRGMQTMECFEDVEFWGEQEVLYGNKTAGIFLLTIVANVTWQYELIDNIVLQARNFLKSIDAV